MVAHEWTRATPKPDDDLVDRERACRPAARRNHPPFPAVAVGATSRPKPQRGHHDKHRDRHDLGKKLEPVVDTVDMTGQPVDRVKERLIHVFLFEGHNSLITI